MKPLPYRLLQLYQVCPAQFSLPRRPRLVSGLSQIHPKPGNHLFKRKKTENPQIPKHFRKKKKKKTEIRKSPNTSQKKNKNLKSPNTSGKKKKTRKKKKKNKLLSSSRSGDRYFREIPLVGSPEGDDRQERHRGDQGSETRG